MPAYEYRCRACGMAETWDAPVSDRDHLLGLGCVHCGTGRLKRVYSFAPAPVMHEHFNDTVGKPISSMRQFRDEVARMNERNTLRTGIPHNAEPCHPMDIKPPELD